jgi:hypothetical protein
MVEVLDLVKLEYIKTLHTNYEEARKKFTLVVLDEKLERYIVKVSNEYFGVNLHGDTSIQSLTYSVLSCISDKNDITLDVGAKHTKVLSEIIDLLEAFVCGCNDSTYDLTEENIKYNNKIIPILEKYLSKETTIDVEKFKRFSKKTIIQKSMTEEQQEKRRLRMEELKELHTKLTAERKKVLDTKIEAKKERLKSMIKDLKR